MKQQQKHVYLREHARKKNNNQSEFFFSLIFYEYLHYLKKNVVFIFKTF
jgi:hypothetical protein